METKTVKELKAIAKERGLKKYSQLRKAELITLLGDAVAREAQAKVPSEAKASAAAVAPKAQAEVR